MDIRTKIKFFIIIVPWNVDNNAPIYYNTANTALARLGFSICHLDQFCRPGDTVGFSVLTGTLVIFFIGNHQKYGKDVAEVIFKLPKSPEQKNKIIDFTSLLFKTYCNTITAMEFFKSFSGWNGAIPAGVFSAFINYQANAAYYRKNASSIFTLLPNRFKKILGYLTSIGFSLSSSIFYAMSLAYFRGHLEGNEKNCFEDPDTLDRMTQAGCILTLLSVAPATFFRYHNLITKRFGLDTIDFTQYSITKLPFEAVAAFFKTLIAGTSAYAFFHDHTGKMISGTISAVGAAAGGLVQYSVFSNKAHAQNSEGETLLPLTAGDSNNPSTEENQSWWGCIKNIFS